MTAVHEWPAQGLDWLLDAYYKLPCVVAADESEAARDRALRDAILTGTGGVAKPLEVLDLADRERFAATLVAHFDRVLTVIVAPPSEVAQARARLEAPRLRDLADRLRADYHAVLSALSGARFDPDCSAFRDVCRSLLHSELCPELFGQTEFDALRLSARLEQRMKSNLITTLQASDGNRFALRELGRKAREKFRAGLGDGQRLAIEDFERRKAELLADFVRVLADARRPTSCSAKSPHWRARAGRCRPVRTPCGTSCPRARTPRSAVSPSATSRSLRATSGEPPSAWWGPTVAGSPAPRPPLVPPTRSKTESKRRC